MTRRAVVLALLALVAACGGDVSGRPAQERTFLCGSYEPLGESLVPTEPPC